MRSYKAGDHKTKVKTNKHWPASVVKLAEQSPQSNSLEIVLICHPISRRTLQEERKGKLLDSVIYILCFLVSVKDVEFDKHSYHVGLGLSFNT